MAELSTTASVRGDGRLAGLDGLRFFAALGVAITHIEQAKSIFGVANLYRFRLVAVLGDLCVSLFFVLSGFLITYLLLTEIKQTGKINLVYFYVRRILRIWPVYFALVILGFFILPAIPMMAVPGYQPPWTDLWWKSFSLYVIFSPHVAEVWLPGIPYAGVLWSVGVEEWFYLLWPFILLLSPRRSVAIMATIAIVWVAGRWFPWGFATLMRSLRFECLSIGALFASLAIYARDSRPLSELAGLLHIRETQYFVLLAVPFTPVMTDNALQAVIFGALIFNLATNENCLLKLDAPAFKHLGAISYSMYAFNWVTAVVAVKIAGDLGNRFVSGVTVFVLGIALILAVGNVSYY